MSKVLHSGMAVEDALTDSNPITRSLARMGTSSAMEEITKLINVELNRPDIKPHQFLEALGEWMLMVHASVAGQVFHAEAADTAARCLRRQLDDIYAEHFRRVAGTDFRKELGLDLPH